ncbi:MAG: IgA Peptidase M64 [Thermoanaerobaculales bacterium]|nr:IgA Peptidase M64 [Thermoanaerobaculales bacterium]
MRTRPWTTIVLALLLGAAAAAAADFEAVFEDATLRVDTYHGGDAASERITIDRVLRQGPWAGSRTLLVDPFPSGGYLVEARDAATGELLFSQGFDSYFGEYRTTGPAAAGVARTYHESVLLPFPRRAIDLRFTARRRDGSRLLLAESRIEPAAAAAEPPARGAVVVEAQVVAPPARALDIAILGEGYTSAELDAFRGDLRRAADALLGFEPFAAHRERINVRGVLLPSAESGCDEPSRGIFRDTALGLTFDSLGSERYLLTEDNRRLRDIAANVPYDALVIMVNHERYGGGGIYGLYCSFTARSPWADYLLLHELGHSFAGLADEYYSSEVAYNDFYPRGREPEEPNITALLDPGGLKWRDLVTQGASLPTPWEKEAYDARDGTYQAERRRLTQEIAEATRSGAPPEHLRALADEEDALAAAHSRWTAEFLGAGTAAGVVGAFEGAGYSSEGLYRPQTDCLMFSRRAQPYCAVCRRAVEAMLLRHVR